jgi:hypothetical protein
MIGFINYYYCHKLTVKLKIDPIKLPSSYLDNFDREASKTDINLAINPWCISLNVLSI